MKNVSDCQSIPYKGNESKEATKMKKKLCEIGKKLGFEVDVEEKPESELGDLGIRHDVLWYSKSPEWYNNLLEINYRRHDLNPEYKNLLQNKMSERLLYAAFEIEAKDQTTKGMKGDISNLSKLPYGIIVVSRGSLKESKLEKYEAIRNRFERARAQVNCALKLDIF